MKLAMSLPDMQFVDSFVHSIRLLIRVFLQAERISEMGILATIQVTNKLLGVLAERNLDVCRYSVWHWTSNWIRHFISFSTTFEV